MAKKIQPHKKEIVEKTTFSFSHIENAKNVAIALAMGGYFVNVYVSNGAYQVNVYTDRKINH